MAGCSTWVFFSVAGALLLLYLFFVAGVAHHTHTQTHKQNSREFFPDTLLTSGGFHPKPIYETNFANKFWCFSFNFFSPYHHFPKNMFSNILATPLATPKRHGIYEPNSPFFFEIHPKFSYNHFLGNYMKTLGN